MADLAEKREARRRKILQNSEKRMNRLLGKPSDNESDTVESESPVSTDESERTTPSPTDVPPNTLPVRESGLEGEERYKMSNSSSSTHNTNSTVLQRPPLSSLRASPGTASALRTGSSSPTVQTKHTAEETRNLLQIMENIRLGACIFLAFLIRWVLCSGYGIFYFQTIFLPFILLETGIYSFHYTYMKEIALPHTSSLMSGALMLCGIKPELVNLYNRTMGYVSAVTEDSALYLFTFLVCNAVM